MLLIGIVSADVSHLRSGLNVHADVLPLGGSVAGRNIGNTFKCPSGWSYDSNSKECKLIKPVDPKNQPFKHLNGTACPVGWSFDPLSGCYVPGYLPTPAPPTRSTPPPKPTCQYHQHGVWPDCHWDACPKEYKGSYWPNCYLERCAVGYHGVFPNCVPIPPTPTCPPGLTGSPPNCHVHCPQYGN